MKMRQKRVNREVIENMKPLELTPFETVERFLYLTEHEVASPNIQKLRDDIRRNAINHDIILGLFP